MTKTTNKQAMKKLISMNTGNDYPLQTNCDVQTICPLGETIPDFNSPTSRGDEVSLVNSSPLLDTAKDICECGHHYYWHIPEAENGCRWKNIKTDGTMCRCQRFTPKKSNVSQKIYKPSQAPQDTSKSGRTFPDIGTNGQSRPAEIFKSKAQMNWEVGKEQEARILKFLEQFLDGAFEYTLDDFKDLFAQIRQNEYRRGKEDGKEECKQESREFALWHFIKGKEDAMDFVRKTIEEMQNKDLNSLDEDDKNFFITQEDKDNLLPSLTYGQWKARLFGGTA